MIRNAILSALGLMLICNTSAQQGWREVDSLFQPLPPSMHVYMTTDSLDGKPNIAYYVSISLKDREIIFDTDTALNRGLRPSAYFERNDMPLVVVNCTFFSRWRRNLNIVVDNGEMVAFNVPSVFSKEDSLYHYITRSAIGINNKRIADVAWIYTDTVKRKSYEVVGEPVDTSGESYYLTRGQLKVLTLGSEFRPWKMQVAVGGGPNLISAGEINITNEQERMFTGKSAEYKHPRTAMGYTSDGYLIIMAIEGRFPGKAEGATLLQEAIMLKALGCVEALNLDGGGSSCMLVNGKETITPSDPTGQRPIPAVFMVKRRN